MKASRKIPMQKRETRAQRAVSFSKRRYGLFNKAAELCMLSGAQIAMVVSSPCSKESMFSFGHPSVDSVFDAFLLNRVPEPVDNEIIRSAVSLCNGIKALEKEPGNREKTDGFLKDFEDLEKSFESIDELLILQEKMENLKNNALVRLSDLLSSKVFASGFTSDATTSNFGNSHIDNVDFSNGISTALASEFSHLDEILMNGGNIMQKGNLSAITNSVFNPDFIGKLRNNNFNHGNADGGINIASTSNVVYLDGNYVNADESNHINQEAYFDHDYYENNVMATLAEYENKEFPLYPCEYTDAISYGDCGHQNIFASFADDAMPLATMNQFGQLLYCDLPHFFPTIDDQF